MLEYNKDIQLHVEEQIDEQSILGPGAALNLFRICQEAFNNCLKHGACKNIKVTLQSIAHEDFVFILEDDGMGFDTNNAIKTGHYGLQNMHARAIETGASLTIESKAGQGTKIILRLPLSRKNQKE
ncbi:MAG: hypothetical protein H7296_10285 [Bacteroidia bacterium]|nr:hypothetical protein [Bacteroidia bacterium]